MRAAASDGRIGRLCADPERIDCSPETHEREKC